MYEHLDIIESETVQKDNDKYEDEMKQTDCNVNAKVSLLQRLVSRTVLARFAN
jgi:hypothetical protein